MSADPRLVAEARSIPKLTYREVSELAYYGARVLHPKTMRPCISNNIPLRIKNTFNPDHPGTVIVPDDQAVNGGIKAVTAIEELSLVTIEGKGDDWRARHCCPCLRRGGPHQRQRPAHQPGVVGAVDLLCRARRGHRQRHRRLEEGLRRGA
jgi:aspartate kinase